MTAGTVAVGTSGTEQLCLDDAEHAGIDVAHVEGDGVAAEQVSIGQFANRCHTLVQTVQDA